MDKKTIKKLTIVVWIIAAFVFVVNILFGIALEKKAFIPKMPAPTQALEQKQTFLYKGHDGKDALTLLKEKARIEQDQSGLVILVNNRKAESAHKEYWAFYINGKMAEVGSAAYQTKNSDTIEWRIEKY